MDLYSWRWMSQCLRETNYQTDLSARCPVGDVTSRTWVVLQKPEAASWIYRPPPPPPLPSHLRDHQQSIHGPAWWHFSHQGSCFSTIVRLLLISASFDNVLILLIDDTLEASEDKEICKGINFRAGRFNHRLASLSTPQPTSSRKMLPWKVGRELFTSVCVWPILIPTSSSPPLAHTSYLCICVFVCLCIWELFTNVCVWLILVPTKPLPPLFQSLYLTFVYICVCIL